MKIETTNIGLVLLTALVATKYFISLDTYTSKDGSFKSGLAIDYNIISDFILEEDKPFTPELLAYNPPVSETKSVSTNSKNNVIQGEVDNQESLIQSEFTFDSKNGSNETIPMEHANSLVVFDPSNPVLIDMKTQYVDQYDNATPLDNGNTLVNEMQMMMPRR